MKTIKKMDQVRRVTEAVADDLIANQGWNYCPKSEYKALHPKKKVAKKTKKVLKDDQDKEPKIHGQSAKERRAQGKKGKSKYRDKQKAASVVQPETA